jgi:(1->4)-alpha-D-glucan 1-alpha-D-glucosylmutase
LATATHDTKRGEDARARINVLSEMLSKWREAIQRWSRLNAATKSALNGNPAPHPNDEYLFYQTLIGAWPQDANTPGGLGLFRERVSAYMLKAIREAKAHTSWTNPNAGYEAAMRQFVESLLADSEHNSFLEDFKPFQDRVAFFGRFNSLSQVLLKVASPGVPDFYQGSELWDFNLVDPDNRRLVDYELRRSLLADIHAAVSRGSREMPRFLGRLMKESHTGEIKLYLTCRALNFRRRHRQLFEEANYVPLEANGPKAGHICSFARVSEHGKVIAIAPRLVLGLTKGLEQWPLGSAVWQDTHIAVPDPQPGDKYRNVLTDEIVSPNPDGSIQVAAALGSFPVALLKANGSPNP